MKIYIFVQESNVDGEILFNSTPCSTREIARRLLKEEKDYLLHSGETHYSRFSDNLEEYFEIEETEDTYYINDLTDDYYEDLWIVEKDLVEE